MRPRTSSAAHAAEQWWIWRHPRPRGVVGRCIGRTDVGLDPRKAKRLAHRIQRFARLHQLPREVWTSPLKRAHRVGAYLARWGWVHHVDVRLAEADFGAWDGELWANVARHELDAWCERFATYAPGGGESLEDLFARCGRVLQDWARQPRLAVGHAGWMSAARFVARGQDAPTEASMWPASEPYCTLIGLAWTDSA